MVAGLLFLVFASPSVYTVSNLALKPAGVIVVDEKEQPTLIGRFIHATLFSLTGFVFMYFSIKYARISARKLRE
jgi:hypothetical protein